jgi:prophage maintenance system killer protein
VLILILALEDGLAQVPIGKELSVNGQDKNFSYSIPADWGSISSSWTDGKEGFVYIIEDAHTSLEAQKNIASIIHDISVRRRPSSLVPRIIEKEAYPSELVVCVEGFDGELGNRIDEAFSDINDLDARTKTAAFLMQNGEMTGAQYARALYGKTLPLYGVEYNAEYHINLEEFKNVLIQWRSFEQFFNLYKQKIVGLKEALYPPDILQLDLEKKEFENQNESCFIERLIDYSQKMSLPLTSYPLIDSLVKSAEMQTIDFIRLVEESRVLFTEIKKNSLQGDSRLLSEFEKEILLIEKLFTATLTRAEWNKGFEDKHIFLDAFYAAEEWFAEKTQDSVRLDRRLFEASLDSATDFYRSVCIRDKYMAKNTYRRMKWSKTKSAILVAGGFHTEGLKFYLKEYGLSYAVIRPRIEKIDEKLQSVYFQKNLGTEATPLRTITSFLTRSIVAANLFTDSTVEGLDRVFFVEVVSAFVTHDENQLNILKERYKHICFLSYDEHKQHSHEDHWSLTIRNRATREGIELYLSGDGILYYEDAPLLGDYARTDTNFGVEWSSEQRTQSLRYDLVTSLSNHSVVLAYSFERLSWVILGEALNKNKKTVEEDDFFSAIKAMRSDFEDFLWEISQINSEKNGMRKRRVVSLQRRLTDIPVFTAKLKAIYEKYSALAATQDGHATVAIQHLAQLIDIVAWMNRFVLGEIEEERMNVRSLIEHGIDELRGSLNDVVDVDLTTIPEILEIEGDKRGLKNAFARFYSNGFHYKVAARTTIQSNFAGDTEMRIATPLSLQKETPQETWDAIHEFQTLCEPVETDLLKQKLFERDAKGKYGRSGLGMALAWEIFKDHGIRVRAEIDQKGTGAVFVITIPKARIRLANAYFDESLIAESVQQEKKSYSPSESSELPAATLSMGAARVITKKEMDSLSAEIVAERNVRQIESWDSDYSYIIKGNRGKAYFTISSAKKIRQDAYSVNNLLTSGAPNFIRIGSLFMMEPHFYETLPLALKHKIGTNVLLVPDMKKREIVKSGFSLFNTAVIFDMMDKEVGKKAVIDAGAGDGILSLIALKLGSSSVDLFEIDAGKLSDARTLLELNGYVNNKDFFLHNGDLTAEMFLKRAGTAISERLRRQKQSAALISNIGTWPTLTSYTATNQTSFALLRCVSEIDLIIAGGNKIGSENEVIVRSDQEHLVQQTQNFVITNRPVYYAETDMIVSWSAEKARGSGNRTKENLQQKEDEVKDVVVPDVRDSRLIEEYQSENTDKPQIKKVYDPQTGIVWEEYFYLPNGMLDYVLLHNPVTGTKVKCISEERTQILGLPYEIKIWQSISGTDNFECVGFMAIQDGDLDSTLDVISIQRILLYKKMQAQGKGIGTTIVRWVALNAARNKKRLRVADVSRLYMMHLYGSLFDSSSLTVRQGGLREDEESGDLFRFANQDEYFLFLQRQELTFNPDPINGFTLVKNEIPRDALPDGYSYTIEKGLLKVYGETGELIPVYLMSDCTLEGLVDTARINHARLNKEQNTELDIDDALSKDDFHLAIHEIARQVRWILIKRAQYHAKIRWKDLYHIFHHRCDTCIRDIGSLFEMFFGKNENVKIFYCKASDMHPEYSENQFVVIGYQNRYYLFEPAFPQFFYAPHLEDPTEPVQIFKEMMSVLSPETAEGIISLFENGYVELTDEIAHVHMMMLSNRSVSDFSKEERWKVSDYLSLARKEVTPSFLEKVTGLKHKVAVWLHDDWESRFHAVDNRVFESIHDLVREETNELRKLLVLFENERYGKASRDSGETVSTDDKTKSAGIPPSMSRDPEVRHAYHALQEYAHFMIDAMEKTGFDKAMKEFFESVNLPQKTREEKESFMRNLASKAQEVISIYKNNLAAAIRQKSKKLPKLSFSYLMSKGYIAPAFDPASLRGRISYYYDIEDRFNKSMFILQMVSRLRESDVSESDFDHWRMLFDGLKKQDAAYRALLETVTDLSLLDLSIDHTGQESKGYPESIYEFFLKPLKKSFDELPQYENNATLYTNILPALTTFGAFVGNDSYCYTAFCLGVVFGGCYVGRKMWLTYFDKDEVSMRARFKLNIEEMREDLASIKNIDPTNNAQMMRAYREMDESRSLISVDRLNVINTHNISSSQYVDEERQRLFKLWYQQNARQFLRRYEHGVLTENEIINFAAECFVMILRTNMYGEGNHRTAFLFLNNLLYVNNVSMVSVNKDNIDEYNQMRSIIRFNTLKKWWRPQWYCTLLYRQAAVRFIKKYMRVKGLNEENIQTPTQRASDLVLTGHYTEYIYALNQAHTRIVPYNIVRGRTLRTMEERESLRKGLWADANGVKSLSSSLDLNSPGVETGNLDRYIFVFDKGDAVVGFIETESLSIESSVKALELNPEYENCGIALELIAIVTRDSVLQNKDERVIIMDHSEKIKKRLEGLFSITEKSPKKIGSELSKIIFYANNNDYYSAREFLAFQREAVYSRKKDLEIARRVNPVDEAKLRAHVETYTKRVEPFLLDMPFPANLLESEFDLTEYDSRFLNIVIDYATAQSENPELMKILQEYMSMKNDGDYRIIAVLPWDLAYSDPGICELVRVFGERVSVRKRRSGERFSENVNRIFREKEKYDQGNYYAITSASQIEVLNVDQGKNVRRISLDRPYWKKSDSRVFIMVSFFEELFEIERHPRHGQFLHIHDRASLLISQKKVWEDPQGFLSNLSHQALKRRRERILQSAA